MNFPRIGTYSSLRGNKFPADQPGWLDGTAQWDDVIIELGTMNLYPELMAGLRQRNPNIRLHAYVVMSWWTSGIPFFKEFAQIVHDTNGILVGSDGHFWSYSNVNLARRATMEGLANLILDDSAGWDSIFIDILIPAFHGQTDIGWQQMGYSSYLEFEAAWNTNAPEFVYRLKSTGKPVTTNFGNSFPHSNGNMREAFPSLFGGTWHANMVENQWRQPGQINLEFAPPRNGWICSAFHNYNPNDKENARIARYHDGSACLSGDFGSFGRYEWDVEWCKVRHKFFAPHYVHPQKGKGWLGAPTAPTQPYEAPTTGLWIRGFEHGLVVVNPDSSAHSIYLPQRYRPIGNPMGAVKDAFSVPPHDALLLEAV